MREFEPAYNGPNDVDFDNVPEYDLGAMPDDLPAARDVSNAVMDEPTGNIPNSFGVNEYLQFYGQLLTHDIAETELGAAGAAPPADVIPVAGLPFPFVRTPGHASVNDDGLTVREQENEETSYLDLTMVYGSSDQGLTWLRRKDDPAYMLTGDGDSVDGDALGYNLLPTFDEVADHHDIVGGGTTVQALLDPAGVGIGLPTTQFAAGDNRVNQNAALITQQTQWMRNHNWHVDQLKDKFDGWSADEYFDAARLLNEAEWQQTVYGEYLKKIVGETAIAQYSGYKADVNPSIINEFTTTAFRFGHDQSNNEFDTVDEQGNVVVEGATLRDSFALANAANIIRTDQELREWILGQTVAKTQEIDGKVVDGNRNFLFGLGPIVDLETLDIQRGRDHGVWNYNAIREGLGLSPYSSIDEFINENDIAEPQASALKSVYGDDIDKVDTVVAGLLDKEVAGSMLGETFTALIVMQFERLRDGDRYYFENLFKDNPDLIQAVKSTSLAEIIERTTGVEHVHYDAFQAHERVAEAGNFSGGADADLLIGLGGANSIRGQAGNDHLFGDAGNDVLNGGAGSDAFVGGDGGDRYVIASTHVRQDDVDWIQDLSFSEGDHLHLEGLRPDFRGALDRDERVASEAELKALVDSFQNDIDPTTNAYNVTTYDDYVPSEQLILEWRGYQLKIDGFGELAGAEGITFRVSDRHREIVGVTETDTDYAPFVDSSLNPTVGDGLQLIIEDFSLWEGDALVLVGASSVGTDGVIDDRDDLATLLPHLVSKIDADGDGVANDLYFEVPAETEFGDRNPDDGYDIVFRDIAGREFDDFNEIFLG